MKREIGGMGRMMMGVRKEKDRIEKRSGKERWEMRRVMMIMERMMGRWVMRVRKKKERIEKRSGKERRMIGLE
ncbi:MAG: hypothetical protein LBH46_01075 [Rickettsiales bacterium]|jgi:hypothetical protein|nr:hypothetical protein [Rickettsiales bacterium]